MKLVSGEEVSGEWLVTLDGTLKRLRDWPATGMCALCADKRLAVSSSLTSTDSVHLDQAQSSYQRLDRQTIVQGIG
jgi:hypothetical protein